MGANIGTVRSVDRETGKAIVQLSNGLMPNAKYQGIAPWPEDRVKVSQIGPADWIIDGSAVGERDAFGPNVFPNPNMENAGIPLLTDGSFESGTDVWIASASTAIAQSNTVASDGTFSLRLTRTGTGGVAEVSGPASTYACVPGTAYNLMAWVRAGSTGRATRSEIRFYAADGTTLLDTYTSPSFNDSSGSWQEAWITGVAPLGAAWMRPFIRFGGTVSVGEFHYVDDVMFREATPGASVSGATTWLFDSDIQSWSSGTGGTLTWSGSGYLSEPGCVIISTPTPGTNWFESPGGTSGVGVIAGKRYTSFAFLKPEVAGGTERIGFSYISWFNVAGTYLSTSSGPNTTIANGEWTQLLQSNATAPAGAVYAAVGFQINGAGTDQSWILDTGVLVQPPNARIRRNTDTTYTYTADLPTSFQITALASGLVIGQLYAGINADSTGALAVNPGEYLACSIDYKNHVANSVYRNVALVATWYDDDGEFLGITLGSTPILSDPGPEWSHAQEIFQPIDGAGFMRLRIVALAGAAGDAWYIANIEVKHAELAPKRIQTQGQIQPYTTGATDTGYLDIYGNYGGTFISSNWWTVVEETINMPVTVQVIANGFALTYAGTDYWGVRATVSFDGGVTWNAGQTIGMYGDSGYLAANQQIFSCSVVKTERPVGPILVALERTTGFMQTDIVLSTANYSIMPAEGS